MYVQMCATYSMPWVIRRMYNRDTYIVLPFIIRQHAYIRTIPFTDDE